MYRSDVYFLSKTLAELPLFIIFPIIFTVICYFTIGLNPEISRFFVTCGVVVLVSNVACSFGKSKHFMNSSTPSSHTHSVLFFRLLSVMHQPECDDGPFFVSSSHYPTYDLRRVLSE